MEQSGGLGHHSIHGLHMACLTFVYAQSIAWICIISWSYLNPNAPSILWMMRYKCTLLDGYCTKVPATSGTDCISIARIHLAGFICTWYHDKAWILTVSWTRISTIVMHLLAQTAATTMLLARLNYKSHQTSGTVGVSMHKVHIYI